MRLDQFLALLLEGRLSRSRLQALIAEGRVTDAAGMAQTLPKRKVATGELFLLTLPEPDAPEPVPEQIPLTILYEDSEFIVIDKPAGMVVHPAAGNWSGTLVNALLYHCADSLSGIGGVRRPGIVHRLDKDTSGVMVAAKTDRAHQSLTAQFAAHGRDGRMRRIYSAVVWGVPQRREGTVQAALGRSATDRLKRAVVPEARSDARMAVTHFRLVETFPHADAAMLDCQLETGRTHQIRVHMAHIGHPLIGDTLYGRGFRSKAEKLPEPEREIVAAFARQALHARLLGFEHPVTGEPMTFESPLPADMRELIGALSR